MTKWVKFMFSNGKQSTYFNSSSEFAPTFQEDAGEHGFTSPEEALAKSSSEVFIFWDGQPVGAGHLAA